MTETSHLALPLLAAAQAQKHVTHNEALIALDALAHLSALTRGLSAPPASPAEGARYIVGPGPSGAWAGQAGAVAHFSAGVWRFHAPQAGWRGWAEDEGRLLVFAGGGWREAVPTNPAPLLGVNATADSTNRLAVKSNAVLFSHDDVTPGSGEMRAVLNKAQASATASLTFQTGYSGRAEIGLAGDDALSVKTSANGAAWTTAARFSAAGTFFGASPQPETDNALSLGTSGRRWSTVYAATGTINTSDARLKTDVADCPLGLSFVLRLKPRAYRWREGGRVHLGLIAQEAKAALDSAGVDCGLWVSDDPGEAGALQSLRYDQLLAPLIRAVQQLAARLEALERPA